MTGHRDIALDDLESLAIGAGILGTGGGTHPYLPLLAVRKLYRDGQRVRLIDPMALADDARIAMVGYLGAPLVSKERLPDPAHMLRPVLMMQEHTGRTFDAVMSIEIGSTNSFAPLFVGALTGLPVVDADAMGRAFPEAQMTSFAIRGLPIDPFAMADIRDNTLIITRASSQRWTERIARKLCTEVGSTVATCAAPRTGREVKDHAILGSLTKAIRLGGAVRDARKSHSSPILAVLDAERGIHLFTGKVRDVARRTTEGFVRGRVVIEGLGGFAGGAFSIDFQNEFTVGRHDGVVRVTVPDLICVLDSVSGEAVGTETVRYGQRVDVVSLPAADVMTSEEGLAHVGPRAFEYDLDYVALHRRTTP